MSHTTQAVAAHVEGELVGSADVVIQGVEALDRADDAHLTFIGDARHAQHWPESRAAAALVTQGLDVAGQDDGRPLIYVQNADLAMARALELFAPPPVQPEPGIDKTAVVHPDAHIGEQVRIGAHCYVGPGVNIGTGSVLHPHVTLLDGSRIGEGCVLWPGLVVRERCVVGRGCICHPNVTLGADGFGYRPAADGRSLVKIPHIGTVELGDEVELGAGTCIDRGKFSATVIGDGTKIDNLVQIGHNCRIGRSVVIAGHCGIAGSVTIEDGVMVGGMAGIKDHLTIGAGAKLAGSAQVMHDVPAGETWGGSPAQPLRDAALQVALQRKLPEMARQLKRLTRKRD